LALSIEGIKAAIFPPVQGFLFLSQTAVSGVPFLLALSKSMATHLSQVSAEKSLGLIAQ
jgi:hypothetical protein